MIPRSKKKSLAIIGGGVSGIVSAYYLSALFEVTLFEKNDYVGGHTNTVEIAAGPDKGLAVDTGFIVCNDQTYPLFHQFLDDIGVSVRSADMSFGYYDEISGLQYAGTSLRGIFAQPSNVFSPSFIRMLFELFLFNKKALAAFEAGSLSGITLGQYLKKEKVSPRLIKDYLLPMAAAIWSSPDLDLFDFPAETFFAFFKNHGLLAYHRRPQWQTVVGGSYQYVNRFKSLFTGTIRSNCPVKSVARKNSGIEIVTAEGNLNFDKVVLATHADQALKLLADPSKEELEGLTPWSYNLNRTILHTDHSFLPPLKSAWACWNYRRERGRAGSEPVSVTYYMNRLQGFSAENHYCVTLNPSREISPDKIVAQFDYYHPSYSREAIDGRGKLLALCGERSTYFCGSYFGFGFHEDAVRSAWNVIKLLKGSSV